MVRIEGDKEPKIADRVSTVPQFLYGTAWKEDRTEALVAAALDAGFRGIDTANQRKHYHEAGVGAALKKAMAGGLSREELFIQTKYTYQEGQDHRLPYDPRADYPTQVRQSFASSLEHLGIDYLDSLLIHGPRTGSGLSSVDGEVWRTMEELQRQGKVRSIGISNVRAEQVELLCDFAEVPPAFVQNRCYARLGWDRATREVCRRRGIRYQGFSLLTANVHEIHGATIQRIAHAHGRTPAQVVFRFALQVGMITLTGTTDPEHMREDLGALEFELSEEEVAAIERVSG
jgi:diketogulonate reductase-like aldo/keto reductase